MLNVQLSYKPTSSWRILFRYGGRPRQFSRLKKFRSLVVTGGGCHKGVIIQGSQLKHRFSCVRPFIPDKERGYNESVCPWTHIEEWYVCTDGQTIYIWYQKSRTPSLANSPILTTPPGTRSTSLLQKTISTRVLILYITYNHMPHICHHSACDRPIYQGWLPLNYF